jgi:hypothetical protein
METPTDPDLSYITTYYDQINLAVDQIYDSEIELCPRNNPDDYQPCTLPDTIEAHKIGHMSKRMNDSAMCWAPDEYDYNRWRPIVY